jgi:hypothetical protein
VEEAARSIFAAHGGCSLSVSSKHVLDGTIDRVNEGLWEAQKDLVSSSTGWGSLLMALRTRRAIGMAIRNDAEDGLAACAVVDDRRVDMGLSTQSLSSDLLRNVCTTVLAAALNMESSISVEASTARVSANPQFALADDQRSRLFYGAGINEHVAVAAEAVSGKSSAPYCVIPGSLNPFHIGHEKLAVAAVTTAVNSGILDNAEGATVLFEISRTNVDKPSLTDSQVTNRVASVFTGCNGSSLRTFGVVCTDAPLFMQKSGLFFNAVFVIGVDTALRLVDPRYYGDSSTAVITALDTLRAHGNRLLVGGRLGSLFLKGPGDAQRFFSLSDVPVPEGYESLFIPIPNELFRMDISSSQLRSKAT